MTIQEIIAQAEQVRTNNTPDSNTPALVGGVIKELALAHKAIADQMQGGKLIKRIELICDDTKIKRKGSDVALNYVQVKQLVDNPEFFVTLNYLGMYWMLPSYDDGGAIMFSSAGIIDGHVVVTRVIMNTDSELNNYSITAEDIEHKVAELSQEQAPDGHPTYPTTSAVNKGIAELVAKTDARLANLDEMNKPTDIGIYNLNNGAKSTIRGLLIVTRNYAGYTTQFYLGCLDPKNGWSGNVDYKRIYARGYTEGQWGQWELIASEEFSRAPQMVNIGEFKESLGGETAAAAIEICSNERINCIVYHIRSSNKVAVIYQYVSVMNCSQTLMLSGVHFYRNIQFTSPERTAIQYITDWTSE